MKSRRITDGALMLAVFVCLLLVTLFIPVISIVSLFFMIFPFLFYSSKYPFKYSVTLFIASLVLSAIFGTITAIPLAVTYGTTGIAMGYCIYKRKSAFVTFITSSLIFLANTVITYLISLLLFHTDIVKQFNNLMNQSIDQSAAIFKALGQGASFTKMEEQLHAALKLFGMLFPSVLLFTSFGAILIFMAVNFPIARRFGVEAPRWKPFRNIQLPRNVLWYYLLTYLIFWLVKPTEGTTIYLILLNLVFVLQILMIIQGLSFIFFYSHAQNWPKAAPVIIAVFSFMITPVLYLLGFLGLADLGFKLRELVVKK